jgi:hypothetical protein
LPGTRRSGKTSLVVHALDDCEARFVCNDRGFVAISNGRASIRGMPSILKIRPDSMQRLPSLELGYRVKPYHYCATLEETHDIIQERGTSNLNEPLNAPGMSTSQLCDLVHAEAVGQAHLSAIVFPRISPEVGSLRLEPIGSEVAAAKLFHEGLLKPTSPLRAPEAFCRDDNEIVADEQTWETCQRITALVPCYTCSLGPAAFQRPFHIEMCERGVIAFSKSRPRP